MANQTHLSPVTFRHVRRCAIVPLRLGVQVLEHRRGDIYVFFSGRKPRRRQFMELLFQSCRPLLGLQSRIRAMNGQRERILKESIVSLGTIRAMPPPHSDEQAREARNDNSTKHTPLLDHSRTTLRYYPSFGHEVVDLANPSVAAATSSSLASISSACCAHTDRTTT